MTQVKHFQIDQLRNGKIGHDLDLIEGEVKSD